MIFEKLKRYLFALRNSQKYENIICLGYNCEIAYRFYKKYKFIDSSLFGWTYVTFNQLKFALENFELIGNGDFEYDMPSHTIKCLNTGIFFHGRTSASEFTNNEEENEKIINEDKIELKSRIKYLKDKFIKYTNNGKSTLYIRKVDLNNMRLTDDCEQKRKEVIWIYNYLKSFCKNKFKLLIVVEKPFYDKFVFDNSAIITRYVEKYSPDSCVTAKNEGDKYGWNLIFTEFQPKNRKKQKGKLKFEVN
ncbi:hypothetical protein IJG14_06200 [bacterium]|nr:hypothetical protein [bacterium]